MRSLRALAILSLVLLIAAPSLAQVSDEDLAEAERRLNEIGLESELLATEFEQVLETSALLEADVEEIAAALLDTTLAVEVLETKAMERAVEIYMDASVSNLAAFFVTDSVERAGASLGYLEEIGKADRELLGNLEAEVAALTQQKAELATAEADLAIAKADLSARGETLNERLTEAQELFLLLRAQRAEEDEARRIAEEARLAAERAAFLATSTTSTSTSTSTSSTVPTSTSTSTSTSTTTPGSTTTTTATPPVVAGDQVCPVDGFSRFTDTWGAPRSGGRRHEGVDFLAARGTPLVAVESGTIKRMNPSTLGGLNIWLKGDSGDEFYYAHMDAFAPGLAKGQRVEVGELVGYVGTTGNAQEWIPQLHWEFHPGGGGAVNPYPLAKSLCG